jgi:hypothetical protein
MHARQIAFLKEVTVWELSGIEGCDVVPDQQGDPLKRDELALFRGGNHMWKRLVPLHPGLADPRQLNNQQTVVWR